MNTGYTIYSIFDDSVIVMFEGDFSRETVRKMYHAARKMNERMLPGISEIVPSFTTLTVYYDPEKVGGKNPDETVQNWIQNIMEETDAAVKDEARRIQLPICYDPEIAPDLMKVAKQNRLSVDEIIQIHTNEQYFISFIGFSLHIPFIGGNNHRIAVEKKLTQNIHLPVGSVGISESKTGIYPVKTTGEWQIIGRTPQNIFQKIVSFGQPGDEVRFIPIPLDTFAELCHHPDDWEFAV